MAALGGEPVSAMGPRPCPPSHPCWEKGPLGLPFAKPAQLPGLYPSLGAVQMTQAWQEERASKGGYGVGAESVANAEEKAPPIICV